jgi:hypothetical protein
MTTAPVVTVVGAAKGGNLEGSGDEPEENGFLITHQAVVERRSKALAWGNRSK